MPNTNIGAVRLRPLLNHQRCSECVPVSTGTLIRRRARPVVVRMSNMTRIEKLYARLEREDAELLALVVPALRTVVSGWNTGFFTIREGVPVGSGAPIFERARDILALAIQLDESKGGLV